MADQMSTTAPTGQVVTERNLQQALMGTRVDTGSYTGTRNPANVWLMMQRGDGTAIPYYRELEDKDDDVSSALDELKLSVLERDWTVEPGDTSQAALDAKDFALAQLNKIDFDSAMDSMLDAAPYGFSVSELMFDASEGQAALLSVDDCPQELFLFGPRYYPQVGAMQLLDSPLSSGGTPLDETKFAIFSYRGRSRNRTGRPLLRSAFWPSWFKRQVLGLWLRTGEKADGTAITRYADGATETEKQFAVECSENLVQGNAFAIPQGMMVELELLKNSQTRDPAIYEKLFTQMQYAIARAIKGETLTSFGNEGGKGSNAQGNTHADTFEKRSVSLAKKANAVVNKQILAPLHMWNFGPAVPPPVFAWDTEEEEDLTRKGTLFSMAQRLGIPLPAKWTANELKIPPVSQDDLALVPNVSAPTTSVPNAAFTESQNQVDRQLSEFDRLTAQLRKDALELLAERTDEIVDAARQGR